MIKAFEFLYYCLYRVFALIERVGEKDENLASLIYSVLLSTNTIMVFFPLKFIIPKGSLTPLPYKMLTNGIFITIFLLWNFMCKRYFIKRGHYIRIIAHYDSIFPDRKKQMAVIAIAYFLLTPFTFMTLAIWLSRM